MILRTHRASAAALLLLALSLPALAGAETDPPARVARLAYIAGPVSIEPAGSDEWADAAPNRPLTTGDRLWTADGARAEVQIAGAAIRLSERTFVEILNLDDSTTQLRLSEGTLSVRLRRLGEKEAFEVDTPSLAVSPQRPGEFRIDAAPAGATGVVVRAGDVLITGGGQAFTVHPDQQVRASGTTALAFDVARAPERDAFDDWTQARDRETSRSASARYVAPGVVGADDLDHYGSWRPDPAYGAVWVPASVPPGWAPYRFGHWVWIEPWGWTWVDDAPWGFAPFHYGRWAYAGGIWVWVPGPVAVVPVYAPALVVWVGGGGFSLSVSVGGPAVAWFPLAPREVYLPAYRASRAYVTRVNVTNTVINQVTITNVYKDRTAIKHVKYHNRAAPGGLSALPESALARSGGGRPVVAREAGGGDLLTAPPVAPTAASLLGRAREAGVVPRPPDAVVDRPVVARRAPPPPPVPFARRQAALEKDPGHPLDPAAREALRGPAAPREHPAVRPLGEAPARPRAPAEARREPRLPPEAAPRGPAAPPAGAARARPAPPPEVRRERPRVQRPGGPEGAVEAGGSERGGPERGPGRGNRPREP